VRVTKLALTNLRSYKNLELEFNPGPTTFIGNNGSGKTNIAESLIYLAYLSSHRVSQNLPLLNLGSDQAVIRAEIERDNRTLQVDLEINASKANRARLNQNPTKSQREILGALQVIYFSPEDLDLVRGEPTHRRDFLDKLLITRAPRLAGVISDYDRVVKQRNTLLKTRAPENALAPWTEQLINLGAQLSAERISLVEVLNPYVSANYANLEVARQEIERGVSLIGPHRDDLHLQLGDFPAKGYASHGESWSLAISLRIGSYNLLKSEGAEPVLILDDIFAELDTTRRQQLTSVTQMAEQTFITAAVESDLPSELLSTKYYVTPGFVSKERSSNE
jgi:DNA replication and repair protein RecF